MSARAAREPDRDADDAEMLRRIAAREAALAVLSGQHADPGWVMQRPLWMDFGSRYDPVRQQIAWVLRWELVAEAASRELGWSAGHAQMECMRLVRRVHQQMSRAGTDRSIMAIVHERDVRPSAGWPLFAGWVLLALDDLAAGGVRLAQPDAAEG